MRLNPTNLAEFLSGKNPEEFLNTPLTVEKQKAFPRKLSMDAIAPEVQGTLVANQIPVEQYITMGREDLRDLITQFGLQQDNNSFQGQFRRVNKREDEVLKFTFGTRVGNFLSAIITIRYDSTIPKPGRTIKTKILLKPSYNSEHLYWLGIFIHEAAHVWQFITGHHREGKGGKDYVYGYQHLLALDLKIEEHAKAVQDWFNITYGLEHSLISDEPNQPDKLTSGEIWNPVIKALGFDS